jgi:hypothetical protein
LQSADVNTQGPIVGARVPEYKRKLLEAVQHKLGHRNISETVRTAVDLLIEKHLPGATQ